MSVPYKIKTVSSESDENVVENIKTPETYRIWTTQNPEKTAIVELEFSPTLIKKLLIGIHGAGAIEVRVGTKEMSVNELESFYPIRFVRTAQESKAGLKMTNSLVLLKNNFPEALVDKKWEKMRIVLNQDYTDIPIGLTHLLINPEESTRNEPEKPKERKQLHLEKFLKTTPEKEQKQGFLFYDRKASQENVSSEGEDKKKLVIPSKSTKESPKKQGPLSGVVVAVSGLEGAQRKEFREKLQSMGATYLSSWNETATHLVACISQTPKFKRAKEAKKLIVLPQWVEDCFAKKKRLPEEEYALFEGDDVVKDFSPKSPKKISIEKESSGTEELPTLDPHSGSDTEEIEKNIVEKWRSKLRNSKGSGTDEMEQPVPRKKTTHKEELENQVPESELFKDQNKKTKKQIETNTKKTQEEIPKKRKIEEIENPKKGSDTDEMPEDEIEEKKRKMESGNLTGKGDSTDEMEDIPSKKQLKKEPSVLEKLPTFLEGFQILLHGNFDKQQKKQLIKFIAAYGGELCDSLSAEVTHIITNEKWNQKLDQMLEDFPKLQIVKPAWLMKCHESTKLIPTQRFVVVE